MAERRPWGIRGIGATATCALVTLILTGASGCANSGGSPAGLGSGGGGGAPVTGSPGVAAASAAPEPDIVPLGTPMRARDGKQMTVVAFGLAPPSGNEFETPSPGRQCVQATLALVNGSTVEWMLPIFDLGVVDASGQKYDATSFNCLRTDDVQSIVARGRVTARARFEVPRGSSLNLSWVPNPFETEVHQTKLR